MWMAIGSKATGSSHVVSGTPCQDALGFKDLGAGLLGVAVADGAGSASLSEIGANRAVTEALAHLRRVSWSLCDDGVWEDAVRGAFESAREGLLDCALELGVEVRNLATTLQVLVLGTSAHCYGRVGDGACVGRSDGGLVAIAPRPDNVYVNETTFLTSPGALPTLVSSQSRLTACAVFTDGLQHLAMSLGDWTPHEPFFRPMFGLVRNTEDPEAAEQLLFEFLSSERLDRRTDDDRAVVLAAWSDDGV